jgi:hypothetical protein
MAWKLTSAKVECEIRFSAHNLTPLQKFVGAKMVRFYSEPGEFRPGLLSEGKSRTSKSHASEIPLVVMLEYSGLGHTLKADSPWVQHHLTSDTSQQNSHPDTLQLVLSTPAMLQ